MPALWQLNQPVTLHPAVGWWRQQHARGTVIQIGPKYVQIWLHDVGRNGRAVRFPLDTGLIQPEQCHG